MEHLNPANKVLAAKKPKQPKQTQNKQQQHPHAHRQQHQKHQNGTAHHLAASIQRPGSTPFPLLNEAYSLPNGPLPQFHFVLVILAFSIIGLSILCGIGCCLRALFIQRKNRRKRHEKEAEEEAERGERERLVRINQFIARRPSGSGEQQEGGLDNLGADNFLTPRGTGAPLPQIKVTTEEATISGGKKKMEEMEEMEGPNEGELVKNENVGSRKNSRQPNG